MTFTFKQELARKFVHFLSLLIILIYFLVSEAFNEKIALTLLVLILIIFIELEYVRLEVHKKIPILRTIWKTTRREKEKNSLGGDVFFLLGAILVLAVFDTKIAIAAILMTTFGDLTAALFGKKFGRTKLFGKKSLEGTLAELIVDIAIGMIVFFWYAGNGLNSIGIWAIILVMAITATTVETVVKKLDDNLLIPVFAGFNGQIAFLIVRFLRII